MGTPTFQLNKSKVQLETEELFSHYFHTESNSPESHNIETKIFALNQKLVYAVCHRFSNPSDQNWEDVVSEASYHFVEAIRKYNPLRGSFVNFVFKYIEFRLNSFMKTIRQSISASESVLLEYRRMKKLKNELEMDFGTELSLSEFAEYAGKDAKYIQTLFGLDRNNVIPLKSNLNDDDEYEIQIADQFVNVESTVLNKIELEELRSILDDYFAKLTLKQETVIRLKFGLFFSPAQLEYATALCKSVGLKAVSGESMSAVDIAKVLQIDKTKVYTIYESAKTQLIAQRFEWEILAYYRH